MASAQPSHGLRGKGVAIRVLFWTVTVALAPKPQESRRRFGNTKPNSFPIFAIFVLHETLETIRLRLAKEKQFWIPLQLPL
jgi:hypothetical protein